MGACEGRWPVAGRGGEPALVVDPAEATARGLVYLQIAAAMVQTVPLQQ